MRAVQIENLDLSSFFPEAAFLCEILLILKLMAELFIDSFRAYGVLYMI